MIKKIKTKINIQLHKTFNPYKKRLKEIQKNPPKVLIATYLAEHKDYCFNDWLNTIKKINYPSWELLIVDNSKTKKYYNTKIKKINCHTAHTKRMSNTKQTQQKSQEYIWNFFKQKNYDYLLIIESDVFPPLNVIQELMKHDKPVIGALFSLKNQDMINSHKQALKQKKQTMPEKDIGNYACVLSRKLYKHSDGSWKQKLMHMNEIYALRNKINELPYPDGYGNIIQVHSVGFGCVLIHSSVIKEITPREQSTTPKAFKLLEEFYYNTMLPLKKGKDFNHNFWDKLEGIFKSNEIGKECHPDTFFARDCLKKGIPIFLNPYIECEHKRSNWSEVKDK